ncbi:MAG TPA: ATP-binding protein, partial [Candidatus Paceibacterota bacterium]|nr:ATP-binding protein [Candidatus Paceibacterota bacterium]
GSTFPVEISANFFEYQGKAYNLALVRDVTDRRALEVQLRQAQKLEAVGQLAGGVAHDFNNILIAVMMHLDLMQREAAHNGRIRDALNDLDEEMKRAANLTRQLLLFSRRSVMETVALDLNQVVENVLKMLSRLLGEQIKVRFRPANELRPVLGDSSMFDQVIINLSVNARDAMPRGGVLTISTENVEFGKGDTELNPNRRAGSFVKLTVADTGSGMDEEVLKHVFEPFFTTKAPEKGTGLGLATVHGIVKQHHGWIEVSSKPGNGAVFSILIPAFVDSPQPVQPPNPEAEELRGTETILLVEDELKVRKPLSRNLRLMGYTVLEAINASAALDEWKRSRPHIDLLLTDMILPEGMNGLELARELTAEIPGLKTIVISGYVEDEDMRRTLATGNFAFMQKPFNVRTLGKKLRECLNQKL